MEKDERLWTVNDVAEYLQLSVKTIYAKVYKAEIPRVKYGRNLRFKPSEIKKLAY